MKKIIASIGIAIALIITATGGATALTKQQAMDEIANYNCGSVCTKVIGTDVKTTPATPATRIDLIDGRPGFIHSLGHFVPSSLTGNEGGPGGCSATTTTSVKELVYNGPYTSRDGEYTVNSSTTSSTSNC